MTVKSLEDLTTDQLMATARSWQGQAALTETLSKNPATREAFLRLVKQAEPTRIIPEIDARDALKPELEARDARIAKLEQGMLERDVRERLERQRAQAKEKYKLTDDEMLEVQKLMTTEDANVRIPGYDAASRVFAASKTSAVPTHIGAKPPVFEMPEKDIWKGGIGNKQALDKIALNEAYAAWNEVVGAKT